MMYRLATAKDICLTEFRRLLETFLLAETRRYVTSLF